MRVFIKELLIMGKEVSWEQAMQAMQDAVVADFAELKEQLDLDNVILDDCLKFQIKQKAKWEQYRAICHAIYIETKDEKEFAYSESFKTEHRDQNKALGTNDAKEYAKSNPRYRKYAIRMVKVEAIKGTIEAALSCIDDLKWNLKHHTDLVIRQLDGHIL
jgi:hypothetical protein